MKKNHFKYLIGWNKKTYYCKSREIQKKAKKNEYELGWCIS